MAGPLLTLWPPARTGSSVASLTAPAPAALQWISSSEGIIIEVESPGSTSGMGVGLTSLSFANFSSYKEQQGIENTYTR